MDHTTRLKLGAIAGLYLLWLGLWLILGAQAMGPLQYNWDQGLSCSAAALVAFRCRSAVGPIHSAFLTMLGLGLVLLALSWVLYDPDHLHAGLHFPGPEDPSYSDLAYILFAFAWTCAWGYLALESWQLRPPSVLTSVVFALLTFGLATVLVNFYYPLYYPSLGTIDGRIDAVTSGLEYLVLVLGLACVLLGGPPILTLILFAVALLVSGDIAYSASVTPPEAEPIWMFGQCLLLSCLVAAPESLQPDGLEKRRKGSIGARSGLSGLLILLALGGMMLSAAIWMVPLSPAWKTFSAVLVIVVLVAVLVRTTDRFDETVGYVRSYATALHQRRLDAGDWRDTDAHIRAALSSTGLDAVLEDLRRSAANLRREVLFLGPERLFPPPRPALAKALRCFVVMPFSQGWSGDVHRTLVAACEAEGVQPARGDDLFTPTDILDEIWQSIHGADFIVADITGRNPNVLYELGIAHTLAKPVLILSQEAADIPIDLSTRRVILYRQEEGDWREGLRHKAERALREMVASYGRTPPPLGPAGGEGGDRRGASVPDSVEGGSESVRYPAGKLSE